MLFLSDVRDRWGHRLPKLGVLFTWRIGSFRVKVERGETELDRAFRLGWTAAATRIVNLALERREKIKVEAIAAVPQGPDGFVAVGPGGHGRLRKIRMPVPHDYKIHVDDVIAMGELVLSRPDAWKEIAVASSG